MRSMSTVPCAVGTFEYLIYFSSAASHFSQSELKTLLLISRLNNSSRGITGMLLYRDGQFLQFLEGTPEAVRATYNHIVKDKRHHLIRSINSGQMERRIFPEWWMGYKNLAGVRAANTEGYSECLLPTFHPRGPGDPAKRLTQMFDDLCAAASNRTSGS
jgi:hypothetical protein